MRIKKNLPTVMTIGNMVCGFASILSILNHKFEIAAWLIITAMVLDALDGRLARILKSSSKLGAQLDSMADLLTFGIAPALLVGTVSTGLSHIFLWGIGLSYMVCAAFRLARFNVRKEEKRNVPGSYFQGLPTTLSGGTIAQLAILNHFMNTKFGIDIVSVLLPFISLVLGILMVSKLPFFNITNKIGMKQGVWSMILEFSAAILFFIVSPVLALSTVLSSYLIICVFYGVIKGRHFNNKRFSTI